MADQIVPPAAAPDSAMHHLLPHFQGIRSVVENQHHRTPKDQQQRDDCGTAASIGANHGGLGSREEFFKALEQAYLRCDRRAPPFIIFLPHASYEAFWSICCYCSPTAQLHDHHLLSRMKPIHV